MPKSLSLSIAASIIRLFFGLLFNKCVAYFLGPAGLLVLSNFQNSLQISSRISNFGVETGLAAEISNANKKPERIITNAWVIFVLFSIFNFVFIAIFFDYLSQYLLKNITFFAEDTKKIFIFLLVLFGPLVGLVANFTAIINGIEKAVIFAKATVFSVFISIIGLLSFLVIDSEVLPLILWGGSQAIASVFFYWFLKEDRYLLFCFKPSLVSFKIIKELFVYSRMTVISVVTTAVAAIVFRGYVISHLSIGDAGSWQAIVKLTETINGVFLVGVTFYLIPKFSNLKSWGALFNEAKLVLKLITLCYLTVAFIFYFLSDLILSLLYSKEFLLPIDLIYMQFFGGLLQMVAWVFGLVLVVKKMSLYHFISQAVSVLLTVFLGWYFVGNYLLYGAMLSFIFTSGLLMVMNLYFGKKWFKSNYE